MSLQTARVLTEADAELLLKAAGVPKQRGRGPGPVNLTAHQDPSPLPCLCRECLPKAGETCELASAQFFRAQAEAHGRVLWFWVPAELRPELPAVIAAVGERMR